MSASWRPNLSHRLWQFVKLNRLQTGVCLGVRASQCKDASVAFKFIFMKEDIWILGFGAGKSRLVGGLAALGAGFEPT